MSTVGKVAVALGPGITATIVDTTATTSARRFIVPPLPRPTSDRYDGRSLPRGRARGRTGGPVSFGAMAHRVTLIPGDGIGPEVAEGARLVLDAADVGIEWIERPAGTAALDDFGELMPEATLDAIRSSRVALKGPITTPVGTGFRSVNVALRQGLDLFGAVRPARALPGVAIRHPSVDLVVVRENTEDLYAGIEFERGSPEAAALRDELRALGGIRAARGRRHHA